MVDYGFKYANELNYFRGIRYENENYFLNATNFIICLFHEYSHPFINPLVDKYYESFLNLDLLLKEAIANGLPPCYQKGDTLLYEYFVRTNSIILAKKYLKIEEIKDELKWFKEIGFIYIKNIISLTEESLKQNELYEDIFSKKLISYINSLNKKI